MQLRDQIGARGLFALVGLVLAVIATAWPSHSASSPPATAAVHARPDETAASVPGEPEPPPQADEPNEPVLPQTWLPSRGRECARRGKHRGFCQGPRRVPAPHGPAAELAQRLGLGTIKTVSVLLLDPPDPAWVAAAGTDTGEALLFPVDEGHVWRGLQRARRSKPSQRWRPLKHKGIDVGAPEGALIRAVQSGIVAYADNGVRGYGNLLVTVHPDNSTALYAHCRAVYVFPGQRIERGQVVGEVGKTGIARGAHLHFEYRKAGRLRDPLRLFPDKPAS